MIRSAERSPVACQAPIPAPIYVVSSTYVPSLSNTAYESSNGSSEMFSQYQAPTMGCWSAIGLTSCAVTTGEVVPRMRLVRTIAMIETNVTQRRMTTSSETTVEPLGYAAAPKPFIPQCHPFVLFHEAR